MIPDKWCEIAHTTESDFIVDRMNHISVDHINYDTIIQHDLCNNNPTKITLKSHDV